MNKKKIILELVFIPLCIMYLYYVLINNHLKINLYLVSIIILITCVEFLIKYIYEVYVYENKYNFLKVLFIIFCFCLIIVDILNLFIKLKLIKVLFLIFIIILLIYLIYFVINCLIRIYKNKGILWKNAFASFFSFISFLIILMGIIIGL